MPRMTIKMKYLKWLMDMVDIGEEYSTLCKYMLDTNYIYFVGNDVNRALHGLELREEFEEKYGEIDCVSGKECSVLEMLVKLAISCENVMEDPAYGDRTAEWFWTFLNNLGLTKYKNRFFNEEEVNDILDDFLYRHYDKYGNGGMFCVKKPRGDMRTTELWYQLMWWLDENYS